MNDALFAAAISGAVSLSVAIVGYYLTRRKEREADWRKMKLDLYRAYVVALSGVVKVNKTAEDQAKYADAVNSLTLVASPDVLGALYSFVDAVSNAADGPNADLDSYLAALLNALRKDIHPGSIKRGEPPKFRFVAAPDPAPTTHAQPLTGQ